MILLGMNSCPDPGHCSLPWLGLCSSCLALTEREGAKRLQQEAKDHGKFVGIAPLQETTLVWVRKTQEGRR